MNTTPNTPSNTTSNTSNTIKHQITLINHGDHVGTCFPEIHPYKINVVGDEEVFKGFAHALMATSHVKLSDFPEGLDLSSIHELTSFTSETNEFLRSTEASKNSLVSTYCPDGYATIYSTKHPEKFAYGFKLCSVLMYAMGCSVYTSQTQEHNERICSTSGISLDEFAKNFSRFDRTDGSGKTPSFVQDMSPDLWNQKAYKTLGVNPQNLGITFGPLEYYRTELIGMHMDRVDKECLRENDRGSNMFLDGCIPESPVEIKEEYDFTVTVRRD